MAVVAVIATLLAMSAADVVGAPPETPESKATDKEEWPVVRFRPAPTKKDSGVWKALTERKEWRFDAVAISAVLDSVRDDPGVLVEADKVALGAQVSVELEGSLHELLMSVLPANKLDYVVEKGKLRITTLNRAEGLLIERTYECAELCDSEAALKELGNELYAVAPSDEWEDVGGPAKISSVGADMTITVLHRHSVHGRIVENLITRLEEAADKDKPNDP